MTWYAIFDATTGALREVTCSDLEAVDLTGAETLELEAAPDGSMVAWDATSRTFVPNIAGWRASKNIEATAYRDKRINSGCSTSLGVVDADDVSRTNILGAVSMAMIAKGAAAAYSIGWRMHDNSYKAFDADQMIQLGVEVGTFVNACYQASFTVKNAIESAADQAAINAVDVTAGYPA